MYSEEPPTLTIKVLFLAGISMAGAVQTSVTVEQEIVSRGWYALGGFLLLLLLHFEAVGNTPITEAALLLLRSAQLPLLYDTLLLGQGQLLHSLIKLSSSFLCTIPALSFEVPPPRLSLSLSLPMGCAITSQSPTTCPSTIRGVGIPVST